MENPIVRLPGEQDGDIYDRLYQYFGGDELASAQAAQAVAYIQSQEAIPQIASEPDTPRKPTSPLYHTTEPELVTEPHRYETIPPVNVTGSAPINSSVDVGPMSIQHNDEEYLQQSHDVNMDSAITGSLPEKTIMMPETEIVAPPPINASVDVGPMSIQHNDEEYLQQLGNENMDNAVARGLPGAGGSEMSQEQLGEFIQAPLEDRLGLYKEVVASGQHLRRLYNKAHPPAKPGMSEEVMSPMSDEQAAKVAYEANPENYETAEDFENLSSQENFDNMYSEMDAVQLGSVTGKTPVKQELGADGKVRRRSARSSGSKKGAKDAYSALTQSIEDLGNLANKQAAQKAATLQKATDDKVKAQNRATAIIEEAMSKRVDSLGGIGRGNFAGALVLSAVSDLFGHETGSTVSSFDMVMKNVDKAVSLQKHNLDREIAAGKFKAKSILDIEYLKADTDIEKETLLHFGAVGAIKGKIAALQQTITNEETQMRLKDFQSKINLRVKQGRAAEMDSITKRLKVQMDSMKQAPPELTKFSQAEKQVISGTTATIRTIKPIGEYIKGLVSELETNAPPDWRNWSLAQIDDKISSKMPDGWITNVQTRLMNQSALAAKLLGAAVEKGRLTNEDFKFWVDMMPNPDEPIGSQLSKYYSVILATTAGATSTIKTAMDFGASIGRLSPEGQTTYDALLDMRKSATDGLLSLGANEFAADNAIANGTKSPDETGRRDLETGGVVPMDDEMKELRNELYRKYKVPGYEEEFSVFSPSTWF